ncbi:MAG: Rpn family recombination-promoting nuclease/putative transposase [Ruminococcus sp.]|nr:Rpn family recombination-promoting nuclease/putative transposase [Ruminococcus sp.]
MDKTLSERRKKQIEIIKQFRLIDDTFMSKVFEDKACAELLLRIILKKDDLTVLKTDSQIELKNLQGRSSRLDIYAVDSKGKHYDIEVQRDNDGAFPRRARYNSSLMDANLLLKGQTVAELPETYVIFITEHDTLKGGKPIYTIDRKISELSNAIFNDGSHIIYVNGEIRDETELGRLMQDLFCVDPNKMHNKTLSDKVKQFKETEEGYGNMCELMENYAKEYAKEATKEAAKQAAKEIAVNLWNGGFKDMQQIANATKLSLDEVKELLSDKTA